MRCYALIHKHLFIIQNNGIQEESYNNQICKIVTTVERVMLNGTFDYTYVCKVPQSKKKLYVYGRNR